MIQEAIEKIRSEVGAAKAGSRHAAVLAGPMAEQLMDFCRLEEEFAQAVVQGGSFADCMRAVTKGVGTAIPAVEAYQRAVRFYFPGAKVRTSISIDLVGDAAEPETKARGVVLDLSDFL